MGFVHLHVHTHYSLLESAVKIPELLSKVKESNMNAVGVADLGNMFGAVDFYLAAKSAGIKPILGAELYYTTGSRFNKPVVTRASRKVMAQASSEQEEDSRFFHIVLLCMNQHGYRSLCELVSKGYIEGFHQKPRVDRELLAQHSEGLIALSAGLKGEVAFHCATGRPDRAEKSVEWLKSIYKENLYLEVQENGLPEQTQANRFIADFGKKFSIPLVATSEVHYLHQNQGLAHEVLMCIGAGRNVDENKAMRLSGDEFWFKDEQTMRDQFSWCPEAVDNTVLIAEKCNFNFNLKDEKGRQIYHLPDWPVEGENTVEQALRDFSRAGLAERFEESQFKKLKQDSSWQEKKKQYEARLEEELEMIIRTGFSGYFLVVSDFIRYAKSKKIPVGPGRGSGAGSIVAYALKITDIDPIPFNLLFERFINPERISMPDFDIDFCQDRRQEVIEYVVQHYGRERVSQIITFGKLLARGVIRDVGRVLNLSYAEVDQIAKLVPEELGITLEEAFEKEARLRDLVERDQKIAKLFEVARALEGLNRHASVHAAGVVITNRPLVEYCPLYVGKENETVVQYDKDFAEKIGLVKFDFLGLKTLTVIDNAVKLIHEMQQSLPAEQRFSLDDIEYTDPKVFQLISSGDTDGVFQLESAGMKDLCSRVQPSTLEDITAINALYRPGPLNSGMVDDYINRKHGRTEVTYEFEQLAEILEETYGVIVYQEQVMRIARVLAGYSLGEADILRRAMGKKKPEEMAKQKDKFIDGCVKNNIDKEKANRVFDLLAKFAEYGFNKSHSAAYGVLSFQTAYLKTYYPAQFLAALMATEMDNTEKMAHYIADTKAHQIEILPPDVNESKKTFSVVQRGDENHFKIRFGLEAIKGVGGVAVDAILLERQEKGRFHNFVDFCKRVPLRKVNKKVLESLISTGCFDEIAETNRATLFDNIETVIAHATKIQQEADLGQVSIFDNYKAEEIKLDTQVMQLFKPVPDWTESKKLQVEKQLVGFYVSGHPLEKITSEGSWGSVKSFIHGDLQWVKDEFERRKSSRPKVAPEKVYGRRDDSLKWEVTTIALVNTYREILTKKGTRMAFVEIEDAKSKIECVCFPDAFEQCAEKIKKSVDECLPFIFTGTVELDEESPKIFIRSMEYISEFQKKKVQSVVFCLNPNEVDTHLMAQLRGLLVKYRGKYLTYLEYTGGDVQGTRFHSRHILPKELYVNASSDMVAEVNSLFGKDVVRLM